MIQYMNWILLWILLSSISSLKTKLLYYNLIDKRVPSSSALHVKWFFPLFILKFLFYFFHSISVLFLLQVFTRIRFDIHYIWLFELKVDQNTLFFSNAQYINEKKCVANLQLRSGKIVYSWIFINFSISYKFYLYSFIAAFHLFCFLFSLTSFQFSVYFSGGSGYVFSYICQKCMYVP